MTDSRFHNISNEALADMIGAADAKAKAAAEELDDLKNEFKARMNAKRDKLEAVGARYEATANDEISTRIDTKKVRKHLGKRVAEFEVTTISTVCRIKPKAAWLASAA